MSGPSSFSNSGCPKLENSLKICAYKLKLLINRKSTKSAQSRRTVAELLQKGQLYWAKVKVEEIIREDFQVDGLELLLNCYCFLLSHHKDLNDFDEKIMDALSSVICTVDLIKPDIPEVATVYRGIKKLLGRSCLMKCMDMYSGSTASKIRQNLDTFANITLMEKYLNEIARTYGVLYDPDAVESFEGYRPPEPDADSRIRLDDYPLASLLSDSDSVSDLSDHETATSSQLDPSYSPDLEHSNVTRF
ncbi:unnamed protein product [Calicophoron daubneyi]|uniref:IST1 homolog n=1 Tax=Calicophoron daubneyi TaxID=300641 RepID=A0AAV2TG25_CALDB